MKDLQIICNFRNHSTGGPEHKSNHPNPNHWFPPIFRDHLSNPTRGACYWTRRRCCELNSRTSSPSSFSSRSTNEENKSWTAGKYVPPTEGCCIWITKKDNCQSRSKEKKILSHLVKMKNLKNKAQKSQNPVKATHSLYEKQDYQRYCKYYHQYFLPMKSYPFRLRLKLTKHCILLSFCAKRWSQENLCNFLWKMNFDWHLSLSYIKFHNC